MEPGVLAGVKVLGATLQQLLSNEGAIGLRVPFWIKYACKAMLVKGSSIVEGSKVFFSYLTTLSDEKTLICGVVFIDFFPASW